MPIWAVEAGSLRGFANFAGYIHILTFLCYETNKYSKICFHIFGVDNYDWNASLRRVLFCFMNFLPQLKRKIETFLSLMVWTRTSSWFILLSYFELQRWRTRKKLTPSFTRLVSAFEDPVASFLYSSSKTDSLKVVPRMHRLTLCLPHNINPERKTWSAPWASSKQDDFFLQCFSRAVTFSKDGSRQHKGLRGWARAVRWRVGWDAHCSALLSQIFKF